MHRFTKIRSVAPIVVSQSNFECARLGGVVVERPPRVWEVAGWIPGRVIPKTLKMEVMATILGAQGCGVSIRTDGMGARINEPVVPVTYPGNAVI